MMLQRFDSRLNWACLCILVFQTISYVSAETIEEDDVMVNRFWTTQKIERWRQYAQNELTQLPLSPLPDSHAARMRKELERRIELFDQLIQTRKLADQCGIENSRLEEENAKIELEYGAWKAQSPLHPPGLTDHTGLEKLESLVAEIRNRLTLSQNEAEQRVMRLKSLPKQRQQNQDRLNQAQTALKQLPQRLSPATISTDEKEHLDLFAKNARLLKRLSHEQLLLIERQQDLLIKGEELDNRKLKLLQMRLVRVEKELSLYRKAHAHHLEKDMIRRKHALKDLAEAKKLAVEPEEKFRIRWRIKILEEEAILAELKLVTNRWKMAIQSQEQSLTSEEAEIIGLKELTKKAGSSPIVGERLRTIYRRLEMRRVSISQAAIPDLQLQLDGYRTQSLEVQDALHNLDDIWLQELHGATLKISPEQKKGYQNAMDATLEEMRRRLQDKLEHLDAVIGLGDRLQDTSLKRMVMLENLEKLITSHVFWLRDAPPIGRQVYHKAVQEINQVYNWFHNLGSNPFGSKSSNPLFRLLIWIVAFIVTTLGQQRLRRGLHIRLNSDRHALRALKSKIWSLVMGLCTSLPVPLFLLIFGWWLSGDVWSSDLDTVLAETLIQFSGILFLWQALRMSLVRSHLLLALLDMRPESAKFFFGFGSTILLAYFLTMTPSSIMSLEPFHFSALPRLGMTLFEIIILAVLFRLFAKTSPLVKGLIGTGTKSGLLRSWGLMRALIFSLLVGIVIMDILGYRFGSAQLASSAILSMITILTLATIYRLVIKMARKTSQKRSLDQTANAPGEIIEDRRLFEIKLQRFLKNSFMISGFVLLVFFWGIGSGVFNALNEVALFSFHSESGSTESVSIGELVTGMMILLITIWIVRNTKGIFDAFILPHLLLDPGARYALVTITRWTLFITGLFLSLNAIHLSLSRLGWLMAAMGVGIGFGLQEIVANMISGVILLIERPVRVGDVLSVGSISGEVKRINIRATTILNWDRQEVIVPNKDFITKEVINWTLADKVLRLVIQIGVAYGSDIELVRKLLIDIAREHQQDQHLPEPAAYFMGHGDSSLDFKLHVYVADPTSRYQIIDRVNAAINRRLAENNIEIPFPQRDIHIRSGSLIQKS